MERIYARIMQAQTAEVGDLKERLLTSGALKEIALVSTALFLGEKVLADHALTFPMVYQKYDSFLRGQSQDAPLVHL